ncbi:uncharacterized protein LOC122042050 [Zingiber officinale]|uniref:uncharacterized protein LOC122042050 n=1 Tax=Zingiber officinale TaxID=94328 RepID=UPI001C4B1DB1|nr:uncharacterized protein LOC122042050 [Zingiber officinale]
MRVHPAPCNIISAAAVLGRQKKLCRLPHVFSKVLELPFSAEADVAVEEDADGFRFAAATDEFWGAVRAHAIEIHPGVMKVVVRDGGGGGGGGGGGYELGEGIDMNRWRFRLPPCTRPALATAAYADGELVVMVPKRAEFELKK